MESVAENVKLSEVELAVLKLWDEKDIFAQSLEQTRQLPPFIFYDGPPFATGLPHYGHLLAGTIKDIIPFFGRCAGAMSNVALVGIVMVFRSKWRSNKPSA
jgi:isoleucyl-tRNA synthetase